VSGLNKVMLIGHLGADPETRSLNNGGEVTNFRIATSESWKDRDGQRQERTEWHSVVCFNEGLGKVIKSYARKGSKIYIEGQLQTRKRTDRDGNDRYSTEIVMQKFRGEVVLLDKAEGNGGGQRQKSMDYGDDDHQAAPRGNTDQRNDRREPRPQPAAFDTDLDDDVPF
jgi:single-strand DNA-binding protein